ncbi:hypothetical protein PoB_000268400 [Plakobranchus ocellatus]|uniref:Uncharacterized protein n=1 Tax=Plakobranchus ocellatus TaxID=259542 RepID=A0AAV3Y2E7_9GAST|nr:hypothetical protein PoB_000268400 [Plakobranchus ocellatus]
MEFLERSDGLCMSTYLRTVTRTPSSLLQLRSTRAEELKPCEDVYLTRVSPDLGPSMLATSEPSRWQSCFVLFPYADDYHSEDLQELKNVTMIADSRLLGRCSAAMTFVMKWLKQKAAYLHGDDFVASHVADLMPCKNR